MKNNDKNVGLLKHAAELILTGKTEEAGDIIKEQYPFIPMKSLEFPETPVLASGELKETGSPFIQTVRSSDMRKDERKYTEVQQMEQFFQDGFIDRYFGTRLINSGLLRLISEKLPKEFPYHPHWKMEECHIAYWYYQPTMDHIIPISLGGKNQLSNWITTSMKWNMVKNNYRLEQLNWQLYPEGDIREWDGLSKIFVEIVEKEPKLKNVKRINDWYKATKIVLEKYSLL